MVVDDPFYHWKISRKRNQPLKLLRPMVAIGGSSTANIHMDIDTRYKIQGLLKIVHWQSVVIVASKAKIEGS